MPVVDSADISDLPPALRPRKASTADALADLPAGFSIPAQPLAQGQRAEPGPIVVQCSDCARIRHSKCARTAGTGPCLCYQCHKRTIIADAEQALTSRDLKRVTESLQLTLILLAQRIAREPRDNPNPYPPRECACGCGRLVYSSARGGARKKYARTSCLNAAKQRRKRARKREGKTGTFVHISMFDENGYPLPGMVAPPADLGGP
jgi:hypothetical protein